MIAYLGAVFLLCIGGKAAELLPVQLGSSTVVLLVGLLRSAAMLSEIGCLYSVRNVAG